jgi:sigma-B regulation protein RsbU (phosphoserine phosphatase)
MSSMKTLKSLLFVFFPGIAGLILFVILYPRYDDLTSLQLSYGKAQIIEKAEKLASDLAIDISGIEPSVTLRRNTDLLKFHQTKYGLEETAKRINLDVPGYYWRVDYEKSKEQPDTPESGPTVRIGGDDEKDKNSLRFDIATTGELISIINDFLPAESAVGSSEDSRLLRAKGFLNQHTQYDSASWKLGDQEFEISRGDSIYRFSWINKSATWSDSLVASVELLGMNLSRLNLEAAIPEEKQGGFDEDDLSAILSVLAIVIITILVIVNLIKRLRQDKVDFKMAWVISITTTIMMIMMIVGSMLDESWWEILIAGVAGAFFVGLAIFVLAGVAESVAREVWNEKLYTLDNITRGRIFTRKNAHASLRGLAIAGIFLGLYSIVIFLGDQLGGTWFKWESNDAEHLAATLPWLGSIGSIWISLIFVVFAFVVFLFSLLKRALPNTGAFILLGVLIFAFLPAGWANLNPFPISNLVFIILGLMVAFTLLRLDFLSVFVMLLSVLSILEAMPYFGKDSFSLVASGIITCIFPIGFFILGTLALSAPESADTQTEYVPEYLRRISERERFQRELEIARTVQLNFLQTRNLESDWLDVASICIPAYEVGGDYYDFLKLDQNRLGVVVGDVSGKGISAAFFMTLLKGILVSQTRLSQSPREVLIQMNDLFYENAQRGVFISVVYGVFDRDLETFTFSRAGHNPVIVQSGQEEKSRQLCPKGIALGLDKGDVFADTLEEVEVKVHPGEVFVLYTDGFSEAMDETYNEFGEDRLADIIISAEQKSAAEILDLVQEGVKQFTGETPQHDDMTMVVVRIGESGQPLSERNIVLPPHEGSS